MILEILVFGALEVPPEINRIFSRFSFPEIYGIFLGVSVFGNIRKAFFWENIRNFTVSELVSFIFWNIRNFFRVSVSWNISTFFGVDFFNFFELAFKSVLGSCILYY